MSAFASKKDQEESHLPLQYLHAVSGSGSRCSVPVILFRSNVKRFVHDDTSSLELLSKSATPVLWMTQSRPGLEQTESQEPGPVPQNQSKPCARESHGALP